MTASSSIRRRATRLYELPGLTRADVDAIIAFRADQGGHLADATQLVAAQVLTLSQLQEIAPFVVVVDPAGARVGFPLRGTYRAMAAYTASDADAPPAFLQAKVHGPFGFSAGFGVVTSRRSPGSPFLDPFRLGADGLPGTLTVSAPRYTPSIPKLYLEWRGGKVRIIAGTFRLGFGERLTLDDTTRYTPSGIYADEVFYVPHALVGSCRLSSGELPEAPCDDATKTHYETDDFKWRDAFRGLAVSLENVTLGGIWHASLYGFASYQTRSIYQYELYSRRLCEDPRDLSNPACAPPPVYVHEGNGAGEEALLSYSTLPAVFDELSGGGHAEVASDRITFGVTGYGAVPRFHVPQLELDFQRWSKYPFGGGFGAVGTDARVTLAGWNLYAEVARSFDQEPGGGGGCGALARAVYGVHSRELEVTARYDDVRFVNPYARPVSSPDEIDGSRARDEAGLRIKYTDRSLGDLQLRSFIDFWVLPYDAQALDAPITGNNAGSKAGTMNLWAELRGDYRGLRFFEPSLWLDYRNKDLASSGFGACYSSSDGRTIPTVDGEPALCTGELYRIGARVIFRPLGKSLELMLTYIHDFISDPKYTAMLDQDIRATAEARIVPVASLLVRLRIRYTHDDLFTNNRLESSLASFAEVTYLGLRPFHVSVRYDNYLWLDQRPSTLLRTPNPENRFRLTFEGHF